MWLNTRRAISSSVNTKMTPRLQVANTNRTMALDLEHRPETGNVDNKTGSYVRERDMHVQEMSTARTITARPLHELQAQKRDQAVPQVQTAVVHSSTKPSEHRTLVCTSLSKDIEVKLDEIEVLGSSKKISSSPSPDPIADHKLQESRRRQRHLAGGKVFMDEIGESNDFIQNQMEKLEFAELEEHVWLLLWLVLGPPRLQHLIRIAFEDDGIPLYWDRGGARLVWRALQLCCSERGAKSPSAVPLPDDHGCDLACLRDHASRMLEVCAPTRELWRSFGWAGLTVDAVLHKILREDVLPHVALLPAVPTEVSEALRRIDACQLLLRQLGSAKDGQDIEDDRPSGSEAPDSSTIGIPRRKRGRPAKLPPSNRREPGRLERVFLWRFLLELLDDAKQNDCLRWVQREDGIFRILNTDMLARLWGRRHGNPRMTYEKMARAMRTYYRSRVLLPVPRARNLPRKLIYRFAPSVVERAQNSNYQQNQDVNNSETFCCRINSSYIPKERLNNHVNKNFVRNIS